MQNRICVPVLLILQALIVYCVPTVVRQTANGPIEGIVVTSSLHQKYHAFKGVPYAEPPITGKDPYTGEVVDRRFKAPEPIKRRWRDNLIANEFKYSCIPSTHFFEQDSKTSEDCLFQNIYVPAGGAKKKTVLVWIHGGGFAGGDGTDFMYGPDFLLSEDNIVVIMQYRLGIFGFLNLGFGEYTGNMGLKDQQLALQWIHENIEYFDGNKDEILLMGESAGSVCVHFHMLNEESRKYFKRAYLGSGSALNYWALSESNHMKRMQEYSGIDDREELIKYLKTSDSDTFDDCHRWDDFGKILISTWPPTIESTDTVGAFMTKTPEEIYNSDSAPTIDALFALNKHEYVGFIPDLASSSEPLLKENWEESKLRLPFDDFNENTHPEEYKQALESLRKAYFPDPSNSDVIKYGNIDLLSEISFGYGILKAVKFQTRANKAANKNTFLFRFSMESDLNTVKSMLQIDFDGACHGEDLCYLFFCRMLKNRYKKHLKHKDATYDSIVRMVKMITNFARTGNPSIENDTPFKSCESPTEIPCQEISNSPKSSLTTDIMEQLHYETWREIDESYKKISQNF